MFLQTGAEFPWLPLGACVRFKQLHMMVDSRSGGKEEHRHTTVIDLRKPRREKGKTKVRPHSLLKSRETGEQKEE